MSLHKTLLPTRIFFHIIFSTQKSNIFKIQDLLAGLFLATDALIFRVIHYAFNNQIWKKAPPHTTQGAGRYQIWVKTPSTQDLVPAGTKPILHRRSQSLPKSQSFLICASVAKKVAKQPHQSSLIVAK